MNALKFKRIIYIIATAAIVTVAAQVYRNYQNYQVNKAQYINDVQEVLDQSIEGYFADLAREDIIVFAKGDSTNDFNFGLRGNWSSKDSSVINQDGVFSYITSSYSTTDTVVHRMKGNAMIGLDSVFSSIDASSIRRIDIAKKLSMNDSQSNSSGYRNEIHLNFTDSIERIKGFAKQLIVSLSNKSLDFDRLEGYVNSELERRNIGVEHVLVLYKNQIKPNSEFAFSSIGNTQDLKFKIRPSYTLFSDQLKAEFDFPLEVSAKTTYLTKDQKLAIRFGNASLNILKRGGLDLIISLVIIMVVIGSLLYLYKIITEQKQLAEIKNDLISNITHEFKTPIATISTAMEGILNFNQANDPEKTVKYLDISKGQLKKLNGMVEKLLETASLDSNEIDISEDEVEVVTFTKQIFDKFHLIKGDKTLSFETAMSEEWVKMDEFHMENSLGNLVDNAIKYGGDDIKVRLSANHESIFWEVIDNGGKINKLDRVRIFDKFYRVPTGNVHDVKGFGIGLYYTKTLVEKHGGSVDLKVTPNSTNFSIQLPKKNA